MGHFLASKENTALIERAESPKPYYVRVTQTACFAKDIDILFEGVEHMQQFEQGLSPHAAVKSALQRTKLADQSKL